MAIFKDKDGWVIEEGDYRKGGFASRDAARAYNSDRKAGRVTEPKKSETPQKKAEPVKASSTPATNKVSYSASDLTVDRGTEGKWFIMTKAGRVELEEVKSRDGGRDKLKELRDSGRSFTATVTSTQAPQKEAPSKQTTQPAAKPQTSSSTSKPAASTTQQRSQGNYPNRDNNCPVYVESTGRSAGPKPSGLKHRIKFRGKRSSWRIYKNDVHIGTCRSKDDARVALRWLADTGNNRF